ncbi:MAG: pyridoxamine 5'-phosphate oxidase family protein [Hyphomonadaceae bacterium]|nr:pyridoxamine 5'-phosphate oxidase family protein [Hyphomonadaceae bacterium]
MYRFGDLMFTDAVKAAQEKMGSRAAYAEVQAKGERDFELGENERAFIEERDHFFMATVSETGWPYVQHRGGPAGFVRVLDRARFAFPDFRGNRQYLSVGNLAGNDRAAFIFMDYAAKARLKALRTLRLVDKDEDPELMATLALTGYKAAVERAIVVTVAALDWNCPQHITPRLTEEELAAAIAPLREKMARLEAENAELRAKLGD